MLKLFGAVVIVFTFGLWGVSKSERLKKRRDSLNLTISSLNLLENEIDFSQKDIASALLSVGNMGNMPLFTEAAKLLKNSTVQNAFIDALKSSDMCFSRSDRDIFQDFSQSLGSLGKEAQIKSILHAKELFCESYSYACEDYGKYGRLYRNMGFLLGILVAIILF